MAPSARPSESLLRERYVVFGNIASGGMATVQYGRLSGAQGFARPVAIKRLHPHFARDPDFVSMFIDEARICARVSHANVVPVLDVIETPGELALVMEYVHGITLDTLLGLARQRGEGVPAPVAVAITLGVLHGLQAAHEAAGPGGESLGIVHRDISPQNVIAGADGVVRILDFGIAKARGRLRQTPAGHVKGKLLYMPPEQLRGTDVDARADVYGAAAVLWELLVGQPAFDATNESAIVHQVLFAEVARPSSLSPDISPALDAVVMRGLSRDLEVRFASALGFGHALERAGRVASQSEVAAWLERLAGKLLRARASELSRMEDANLTRDAAAPGNAARRDSAEGAGTRILPVAHSSELAPDPVQNLAHADMASASALETRRNSGKRRGGRALLLALVTGASVLAGVTVLATPLDTRVEAPPSLPSADMAAEATALAPAADAQRAAPLAAKLAEDELHAPKEPGADSSPNEAVADAPGVSVADAPGVSVADAPGVSAEVAPEEPKRAAHAPATPRRRAKRARTAAEPRAERPLAPKSAASKATASADCSEPYTVDALGIKRWRNECLR